MISCHSFVGRASQGGHARLTGAERAPAAGGRVGFAWGGSRGRTCSHEPLQWALQGVLRAPLPPGGYLVGVEMVWELLGPNCRDSLEQDLSLSEGSF